MNISRARRTKGMSRGNRRTNIINTGMSIQKLSITRSGPRPERLGRIQASIATKGRLMCRLGSTK